MIALPNTSIALDTSHTKDYQNADYPRVCDIWLSWSTPIIASHTKHTSHHLHPRNLKPKHHCLYNCGVNHIHTSEIVSSSSQYKIYQDLSSLLITEFLQRTNFFFFFFMFTTTAAHFYKLIFFENTCSW
jgi:hypothetical protein